MDTGRTVEEVHLEPGVVCYRRQTRVLCGCARFYDGILDKTQAVLCDLRHTVSSLGRQCDAKWREYLSQFPQLAGVAAGEHHGVRVCTVSHQSV